MEIFEQLLTLPNLVFCLAIWALVFIQRKIVETVWSGAKTNKYWREIFLPVGPLFSGAGLAAAVSPDLYTFPDMFTTIWGRLFFGLVCGLASGLVYRMFKKGLKETLSGALSKLTQKNTTAATTDSEKE